MANNIWLASQIEDIKPVPNPMPGERSLAPPPSAAQCQEKFKPSLKTQNMPQLCGTSKITFLQHLRDGAWHS